MRLIHKYIESDNFGGGLRDGGRCEGKLERWWEGKLGSGTKARTWQVFLGGGPERKRVCGARWGKGVVTRPRRSLSLKVE